MIFLKAEPVGYEDALTVWREGKCGVKDASKVSWWITVPFAEGEQTGTGGERGRVQELCFGCITYHVL